MNKFRSTILGGGTAAPSTLLVNEKSGGKAKDDKLRSIAIAREAARSADHREEDRHRLARETAIIGYKGKMLDAELINLSGGGAMIEAEVDPRIWDRIDLYLGEGSALECAVRWVRGGRIGLEFAHETRLECLPEERDALLLDVIRRSFPDFVANAPTVEPAPQVEAEAELPSPDFSRRSDLRHPLIWNGAILWQHDEHSVRLRNISASGVLIDSQVEFPAGAEVLLDLGDSGQFFANVSWSRAGQAGLVFQQPFEMSALAKARPEIAPQNAKAPTYLDLVPRQSSPWAEGWERRDLADLANDLDGFLKY